MSELMPSAPGTYYGELSPQGEWFWNGTGLPGDAWIPNPDFSPSAVPVESAKLYPTRGDNLERSILKALQIAYNSYASMLTPPYPGGFQHLYPTRGDTAEESARKIVALLYGSYPPANLPALPSPNIYFHKLDPHSGDTLAISLAKVNALFYLKSGGTP